MLSKLRTAATSRTVWTVVALFVVNGIAGVRDFFPGNWLVLVDGVLSLAAIYFRVNRRV